jgi:hypothetical protein
MDEFIDLLLEAYMLTGNEEYRLAAYCLATGKRP